jgi:hypothetical protein
MHIAGSLEDPGGPLGEMLASSDARVQICSITSQPTITPFSYDIPHKTGPTNTTVPSGFNDP